MTESIRQTVFASLMAALIAAGAFLAIPVGPVPIVLQNFFVLLTGLLLGPRWGLAAVGIYLLAGAVGLPVFAGATGGIARFVGPTGGYLLGYLPAVWIVGAVSEKGEGRIGADLAGLALGSLMVYAVGVPALKAVTGMTWAKAFGAGMLPFLPGDLLKIFAAIPVARTLRPVVAGPGGGEAHGPAGS
ncbi:MAG: biotin transporter BioY [Desulfococcaceae bacterium]